MRTLALFDIDETLLRGDSEALWSRFLTENRIWDMSGMDRFMREYEAGTLDFDSYSQFQLRPLSELPQDLLLEQRARFLSGVIRSRLIETTLRRVRDHQQRGHVVLAISASHDFIASPIAEMAGIREGIYTRAEHDSSGYTGGTIGLACFREGKVLRLEEWLAERGEGPRVLASSWFYTDSHNDLPLLERVGHPVAVRPDAKLRARSVASGWEVVDD